MNFNVVLRPLRRLQDAVLCSGLLNVFPPCMKDRISHVKNIMNKNSKDDYTTEEISTAVQKLENVLPSYGDAPKSISEDFIHGEVRQYVDGNTQCTDTALRNLFPPVDKCCGKKLEYRASSKCIVFERCVGTVCGQIYSGLCTRCNTCYSLNSFKAKEVETYYPDVPNLKYFMSTRETVFETNLLYSVDRDM